MLELRRGDLTVDQRICAGSEDESEAVRSTAFPGEKQSPWRRSLPRKTELRDAALEAFVDADVDLRLQMEGVADGLDVERAVDAEKVMAKSYIQLDSAH